MAPSNESAARGRYRTTQRDSNAEVEFLTLCSLKFERGCGDTAYRAIIGVKDKRVSSV